MTSKLVHEAVEKAGLLPLLVARAKGEIPSLPGVEKLFASVDVLAIGAAADIARRRECAEETRIYVPFAPTESENVLVIGAAETLRGTALLRRLAMLRLTGPVGRSIVLDFGALGLEIAQVGLSFGATDLAGPIAKPRGLPVIADDQKKVIKRREIAAYVERAGFRPVFVNSESPNTPFATSSLPPRDHV